ncbi:MAG: cobalamin biosynthesis protein CbiM [Desulfuromonas sp.]|nr:MAG: cobalamin biosynthesis protein CbiM [Desulfuromonas sp.]
MHISDGVMPISLVLGSGVASLGFAAWSLRKTRSEDLPKVAVISAAFFVAALVHVPLGPTSVHLLLPGLVGALLGPSAFLAILVGLVLQSLLFQFGGLTALGGNALLMGLPALACGLLFQIGKGTTPKRQMLVGGLCGGLGIIGSALLLAGLLAASGEDFLGVAKLALAAHLPVAIIEALMAAFIIRFLAKVKPEMLVAPFTLQSKRP